MFREMVLNLYKKRKEIRGSFVAAPSDTHLALLQQTSPRFVAANRTECAFIQYNEDLDRINLFTSVGGKTNVMT